MWAEPSDFTSPGRVAVANVRWPSDFRSPVSIDGGCGVDSLNSSVSMSFRELPRASLSVCDPSVSYSFVVRGQRWVKPKNYLLVLHISYKCTSPPIDPRSRIEARFALRAATLSFEFALALGAEDPLPF